MMRFAIWLNCLGLGLAGLQVLTTPTFDVSRAPEKYYWSSRGRGPLTNSFAPYAAPTTFAKGPAWVWQNELKERVMHSPLIDADSNIYVSTTTRLRKFDSDGRLLWDWQAPPGHAMNSAPALYKGQVFVLPFQGAANFAPEAKPTAVSIAMDTGAVSWNRSFNVFHGIDGEGMLVTGDIMFFGAHSKVDDGTDTVVAANASDGDLLWTYYAGETMWNFSPSAPGDGSLLFSGACGAVFRISFHGELIWKAGPSHPGKVCVPGGGAVGPNGIFYAEYNEGTKSPSDTLVAYNISDGSVVWKNNLPYRAAQYPAVGTLGSDGPLAVVAALGDNPMPPMSPSEEQDVLRSIGGAQRNIVMAFDARTGKKLWESEEARWPHVVAAGDLDEHNITDGDVCYPDAQGIPVIMGDGTVYTSSSHHGDLRAIKDVNKDGVISPSEVWTFKGGKAFLNSPSVAPGMLVAAPCYGPMYVFKG